MRTVRNVLFSVAFFLIAGAASAATTGKLYVIFDGDTPRLRWSLPSAGPVVAYRIDRIIGAERTTVATLTPSLTAALPATDRDVVQAYIEIMKQVPPAAAKPDASGAILRGLLTARSIVEPEVARSLAVVASDTTTPQGQTVSYEVHRVGADGKAVLHASSGPLRVAPSPLPTVTLDESVELERGKITLTWAGDRSGKPEAAATYLVMRRESRGGTPRVLTPAPLFPSSTERDQAPRGIFADLTPPVEKDLTYTIVPVDAFGRRGPESNAITLFSPDFAALDAPKAVRAESRDGKVTLNWEAPANANRAGWKVWRATDGATTPVPITTTALNATSYVDADVLAGTTYYYRVSAVNQRGETGDSSLGEPVRVAAKPPSAPRALAATAKPTRVSLTWEAPPERSAGYILERAIGSDEWVVANPRPVVNPRFDDDIVTGIGGALRYRAYALAFDGTRSAASNVVEVVLPDLDPPPAPSVADISGADGRVRLTLTGSKAAAVTEIAVLRSRTSTDPGIVIGRARFNGATATYTDAEVDSGVTYYYRAVAVDGAGNRSEPSEARAVTVQASVAAPAKPAARVEMEPFPRVVVTASAVKGQLLVLERREEDVWQVIAGPAASGEGELIDLRPLRNRSTEYRLRPVSVDGVEGPPSPPVSVAVK